MKKTIFTLLLLTVIAFSSCQKEESIIIPDVRIETSENVLAENISLPQGGHIVLKAVVTNSTDYTVSWNIDGKEVSTEHSYEYKAVEIGEHRVVMTVLNHDSGKAESSVIIRVHGKYKHGTFILNEGNMTSEQGSLIFISPEGVVTDSVYWRVNGSFMGNVTQDLYITSNKIYIISQNGGGDGKLIVANAETLKREAGYNDELSTLSWPTHIAVIENNAYIRDNNGVYSFNMTTKALKLIPGTKGAAKNRMAVIGDKIFAPADKNIFVIKNGEIIKTIAMAGTVSGVLKSSDNNIWVSCTTSPAQINKINASNYSIIQKNELPAEAKVGAGWGATPGISAKGDTLYFSNASTKIYRHIFKQNKTEFMTDVKDHIANASIVYNNLAVHPVTGEVYFNTIKAYGEFLINDITVFNFSNTTPVMKADYKNHTHFPAGIFFTDNYK